MSVTKIAKLLPALGVACMIGLPALAQTSPGTSDHVTSGTMVPSPSSKPAPAGASKPGKHSAHASLPANEQFHTAQAAASHCPGGSVEWAALGSSKTFHSGGSKYYGKTKHGAYACKSDLESSGFHQAKN